MRIETRLNRTLLALTLTALGAAGCLVQKPSTPVPAAPTIDSFTASTRGVARGGAVTLSWKTSNATSIELREATLGDLGVDVTTLEGSHTATVQTDALFVLVARGEGGTDARAISIVVDEAANDAVSLQALPPIINGGDRTTLVWTAPGATAVTLTANGQPLSTGGQLTVGAITVQPQLDTTYVLTADDRTTQAVVTVQPAVLSLEATPRAARVGDSVTVSWKATGAERVVVTTAERGQLHETTDAAEVASGSFVDTVPPLPDNSVVTYVVAAIKGAERVERAIELNVGTGLAITRFDAPSVAAANGSYQLRWETRAADAVEILVDGATVYRSPTRELAANGLYALSVGSDDFAVSIVATNALGDVQTRVVQVDTVGVPSAATLTADPTTVAAGQPVTLTFSAGEARRARIVDSNGIAVFGTTGQPAESGTTIVYPVADTTYTLTADNLLGSTPVTATAQVTVTGAVPPSLTQYPPTPLTGQNVAVRGSSNLLLHGFPHTQVLSSTQADFKDISSTGTRLLEQGSDVTQLTVPFSTWLWGVQQSGPLTVSRAGWMAFGAAQSVLTSETTLPSTSAPAFIIAPFWDDLTLPAGAAVYAQVLGDAPNEELVVQWDKLRLGTSSTTSVTFQARVSQRGMVSFHYQTMTLTASPTFTVGVQDGTRTLGVRSTATPTSNSALYFFSPVVPPVDIRVTRGSRYGGFVQDGDAYTQVTTQSTAVSVPLDLALTEFMFRTVPAVGLPGQFIEVNNTTTAPLDLTGWQLSAPGVPTWVVPDGFTLAPGVPTVIGGSSDPALNDDAGVTLSWEGSGFFFAYDAGSFTVGTADAGAGYNYSGPADGGVGASIEIDPGGLSASGGGIVCNATTPYGFQVPPQLGSPGRLGSCLGYSLQSIPVHYVDISDGGTALIASPAPALEPTAATITLGVVGTDPLPRTFGVERPVLSMKHDGWLGYGSITSGSLDVFTNATLPSTTLAPKAVIAPFWDDLQTGANTNPPSNMYWKRIEPGVDPLTPARHWIFQWANMNHFAGSPPDDVNFEVKLFEDGTIEFHYGTMTSGNSNNYANGNSATAWIMTPDGTAALPISINQPNIQPNTAYRFVPR